MQNTRKGAEGKSTTQTRSLRGEAHQHNKKTCADGGREPKGKALHKPDVCEAKHTNITNKRVQRGKGAEGKSTTQTRSLRGEAHQYNKQTCANGEGSRREKHYTNPLFARRSTPTYQINVCKPGKEPKGKALHKLEVCKAKYAQHKLDSQMAQAKHKRTN